VSGRFQRVLLVLAGLTTLTAVLLAALEADAGRRADRASADATRLAVALVSDLTTTGLSVRFQVNALRAQLELRTTAEARTAGATFDPRLEPLARAESRAADRLASLERDALGVESGTAGLAAAAAEVPATATRAGEAVRAQNEEIADASRYGRMQGRTVFGLALLAMAGALLGLAGALGAGRPGGLVTGTAAAVLLAAVVAGASALTL
jgi:hypothetical protein